MLRGRNMGMKNLILSKSDQFNHYKDKANQLKKENKELKLKNEELEFKNNELSPELEEGISLIIPSYKGENHIQPLLESLEKQTISKDLFEVIFIVNGEMDSTIDILTDFAKSNPDMNIIISYTSEGGVSNARNIGIRIAKREYIGFLDDDDFISDNYLKALYDHIAPNRVVLSNFIDIDEETGGEIESRLVPYSMNREGIFNDVVVKLTNLSIITTAKIIPALAVKGTDFNPNLNNGVDVSYYARLYPKNHFEFYFVSKEEGAVYYRIRRSGSISRQETSYQFNVLDRLKVIDDINESYKQVDKSDELYVHFLKILFDAQTYFIGLYLDEYPQDREKVIEEVRKHNFEYFSYEKLEG